MSKGNENQVVVTRSGYEHLTAELTNLRTVRRQEVARQLEEARAFGDLSENAEYAAAKEEQSKVEGRILELETMLARIKIVDEESLDTGKVAIGLTVTLLDLDHNKKEYIYTIVGSEELSSMSESNPAFQRISQKSPVGQAILDHTVGDEVTVKIPHGFRHLRIAAITRAKTKAAEEERSESVESAEDAVKQEKQKPKKKKISLGNAPDIAEGVANEPDAAGDNNTEVDTADTNALAASESVPVEAKSVASAVVEHEPEVKLADASEPVAATATEETVPAPKKRARKTKAVENDAANVEAPVEDEPKKKRTRKPVEGDATPAEVASDTANVSEEPIEDAPKKKRTRKPKVTAEAATENTESD